MKPLRVYITPKSLQSVGQKHTLKERSMEDTKKRQIPQDIISLYFYLHRWTVPTNFWTIVNFYSFPQNLFFFFWSWPVPTPQPALPYPYPMRATNQEEWRLTHAPSETHEPRLHIVTKCCSWSITWQRNICPLPCTWAHRWQWLASVTVIDRGERVQSLPIFSLEFHELHKSLQLTSNFKS